MMRKNLMGLAALALLTVGASAFAAGTEVYREQTVANQALHKLGRGVTNVLTFWAEVPRQIAIEWERTDPASGLIVGTIKGAGWGFARLATGVYDAFTFPFPIPENYEPMMEPEFVITDIWGDPIPGLTEFNPNNPERPGSGPVYPQQFSF
ncbi:MAG TPA: exosortase system-associated protein, TIGR04073 family [Candidatus Sumerlaeota bacterium]|nr:MAG: hypothetical protein BWZ08_00139 [candidate division BRC1 bacterium ADurb.BinA292]HOE97481.1 exosortase system-associated protein, TIGR04073 family [Candidatus Sumerlaeota bacterium]HOR28616.1 exosortase system-associated protein, TIGR04073 family [Candidatus Sumerlaeota bacterium]HPK03798.1 exosortase system-associated protein, TIGR04073 family [Candidatus Sumerlaeota bacterium]